MTKTNALETVGAWIVHHGLKLQADQAGASEFPALDGAAKSGLLLAGLAASEQVELSHAEVVALAKTAHLNPKSELPFALAQLKKRQVIDVAANGAVSVLGVSSRKVLHETAELFDELEPSVEEQASIDIAEQSSKAPQLFNYEVKRISDEFRMRQVDAKDFVRRSLDIGFVDSEAAGQELILFNGNLFRRNGLEKTRRIIESLNANEAQLVNEVEALLETSGCVEAATLRRRLGQQLFDKLIAAGFYDINIVSNEQGEHVFVTAPAAFHKFVDSMVDDAFDMAKALVAAVTYGISKSGPGRGRIMMPYVLLSKLVSGREVGPATAIGQDYRILELKRVIQLRHYGGGRFYMRLLKREVGELVLQVLMRGGSPEQVLGNMPSAAMSAYIGPERARVRLRRKQSVPSRKHTADILQTLREQATAW